VHARDDIHARGQALFDQSLGYLLRFLLRTSRRQDDPLVSHIESRAVVRL